MFVVVLPCVQCRKRRHVRARLGAVRADLLMPTNTLGSFASKRSQAILDAPFPTLEARSGCLDPLSPRVEKSELPLRESLLAQTWHELVHRSSAPHDVVSCSHLFSRFPPSFAHQHLPRSRGQRGDPRHDVAHLPSCLASTALSPLVPFPLVPLSDYARRQLRWTRRRIGVSCPEPLRYCS